MHLISLLLIVLPIFIRVLTVFHFNVIIIGKSGFKAAVVPTGKLSEE